jgi:hypothetical protein
MLPGGLGTFHNNASTTSRAARLSIALGRRRAGTYWIARTISKVGTMLLSEACRVDEPCRAQRSAPGTIDLQPGRPRRRVSINPAPRYSFVSRKQGRGSPC